MTDDERKMLVEIHGGMQILTDHCTKHEKTLYGNGRPGLVSRMTRVETIIWVLVGAAGIGIPAILAG